MNDSNKIVFIFICFLIQSCVSDSAQEHPKFKPYESQNRLSNQEPTCTKEERTYPIQCNFSRFDDLVLSRDDSFRINARNDHVSTVKTKAYIEYTTQFGFGELELYNEAIDSNSSKSLTLEMVELAQLARDFDVSGVLKLKCVSIIDGNIVYRTPSSIAYVHYKDSHWHIYNKETKKSKYNNGALSERAMTIRDEMSTHMDKEPSEIDMTNVIQEWE